jgi:hypothetical protein
MKCVGCAYPMRQKRRTIQQFPGTREHRGNGLCTACTARKRAANKLLAPEERSAHMFDERLAAQALECYMAERRKRLASKQGVVA